MYGATACATWVKRAKVQREGKIIKLPPTAGRTALSAQKDGTKDILESNVMFANCKGHLKCSGFVIDRTLWRDRRGVAVDVEGSIHEWLMVLCCEYEKGGLVYRIEGGC